MAFEGESRSRDLEVWWSFAYRDWPVIGLWEGLWAATATAICFFKGRARLSP